MVQKYQTLGVLCWEKSMHLYWPLYKGFLCEALFEVFHLFGMYRGSGFDDTSRFTRMFNVLILEGASIFQYILEWTFQEIHCFCGRKLRSFCCYCVLKQTSRQKSLSDVKNKIAYLFRFVFF